MTTKGIRMGLFPVRPGEDGIGDDGLCEDSCYMLWAYYSTIFVRDGSLCSGMF